MSSYKVSYPSTLSDTLPSIFNLPNIPENKIEVGFWALTIAKEFDSSVDVQLYNKKLKDMAKEINKMLAARTKDMDKFLAIRTYLYEPGSWNQNKSFSYDLNDPLGSNLQTQLLSSYIDSRKGNCVSIPTLFLSLMGLVDPKVQFCGVKAPLHLFCRLKDNQTGDIWNVETTNGGNPARNQWYIDQMEISESAIRNNLYLKDLSKKEFLAELISPLITKERRTGNFEKALKYSELVLQLSPNSDLGLISKGALLAEIGYKMKSSKTIFTKEEEKMMQDYDNESLSYINKAKALGWKQPTKENKEKYLESVKEKNKK